MNGAHLHLIVNHVPVIGTVIGIVFLIAALAGRRDILVKAALWMLLIIGLSAIPAFLTGDGAEKIAEAIPGVSAADIHEHEETAEMAFISALVMSALALIALIGYRAKKRMSHLFLFIIVAVALITGALMAGAATQGGEIRHPEISSSYRTPDLTGSESEPAGD